MSKDSIIQLVLDREIENLKADLDKIKFELSVIDEQIKNSTKIEKREYRSNLFHDITMSKAIALKSIIDSIEKEIELYKTSFTSEMISNLDYILEVFNIFSPQVYTGLIIEARVDIVRFKNSEISESDYNRDRNNLLKKFDKLSSHLFSSPHFKIAIPQHKILKQLIFHLSWAGYKALLDEEKDLFDKVCFNPEGIKALVDTISDLEIIPRGQNEFNNIFIEPILKKRRESSQ